MKKVIYLTAYPMGTGSGNVHGSTVGGDVLGCALSEDGDVLAQHYSSSAGFAMHDMGLTSDWKHESYRAHYPDGYELVWVHDRDSHPGWTDAMQRNRDKHPEEEAKRQQA